MKNQDDIKKKVAENIRLYRKKANMTQKQLAEKLGVKNTAVSNWENGQNSIDTELLFRVCDVFGITINQIYGIEETESTETNYSDASFLAFDSELSPHEKALVSAYRENPAMQSAVDKLLEEGFLEIDNDLYSILSKETAVRLKTILSSYGAKVSGKKDELIHRIIETAPSDIIEKEFPFRCYALTEKGEAELSENNYVVYCHRNDLDEREISKIIHEKNLPYRDAIWSYFNKQSIDQISKKDFISYISTKEKMADFLIEEKNYKQSLLILCEIIAYKLNNVRNLNILTSDKKLLPYVKDDFANDCFPYNEYLPTHLSKYILDPIKNVQWKLDVSDFDYKNMILEEFHRLRLPFYIFHDEEMADIVLWEIQGNTESLIKIYKMAESRFLKNGVFKK